MAILSVTEITKDRPGVWRKDSRTYKRYFQVISDDIADHAYHILSHADIPKPGEEHEDDDLTEVKQIETNVETEDARRIWTVTVSYEYTGIGNKKPWEMDPDIDFSYKNYDVLVTKAYDYTKLTSGESRDAPSLTMENSANFQYNPPPTKEISHTLIRITFNLEFTDFKMESSKQFKDTINSKNLIIGEIKIPKYHGRIIKISPKLKTYFASVSEVEEGESLAVNYWEVVYEVEINPLAWGLKVDDYSYKDKDGNYYNNDSDNSSDQYKLDGAGSFKADQTETAVSKSWDIYWPEDWTTLAFPEEVKKAAEVEA